MGLRKKVNWIIYRFRERGLEVFFLNPEDHSSIFPQGERPLANDQDKYIELDESELEEAYAVESDWHEIPSLKGMLYEDAVQLKERLKALEQGTYVSIKDALKQALPHQYAFLKELKDILRERNSLRDM